MSDDHSLSATAPEKEIRCNICDQPIMHEIVCEDCLHDRGYKPSASLPASEALTPKENNDEEDQMAHVDGPTQLQKQATASENGVIRAVWGGFISKRACEGAATIDHGDMRECPHPQCEMRVAWDLVDDPFWGFAASCPMKALASGKADPAVVTPVDDATIRPRATDSEALSSEVAALTVERDRLKEEVGQEFMRAEHAENHQFAAELKYAGAHALLQKAEAERDRLTAELDRMTRVAQMVGESADRRTAQLLEVKTSLLAWEATVGQLIEKWRAEASGSVSLAIWDRPSNDVLYTLSTCAQELADVLASVRTDKSEPQG